MEARNAGKIIKTGIKSQYPLDSVLLHHCDMQRVAGRQPWMAKYDRFGAFNCRHFDGKHLIDDAEQRVKRALNAIATVDCHIAMQYFLQHFSVGDQARAFADEPLKQALAVTLMGMRRPHQVHRYIRVDEDHERSATP